MEIEPFPKATRLVHPPKIRLALIFKTNFSRCFGKLTTLVFVENLE